MINYGKQAIDNKDITAVTDTLNSEWLTQGPKVEEFEHALADYCGSKYAVAVCNGTAALHLANLAVGTDATTNVITTPVTFLATANSVIYSGGHPIFADIVDKYFTLNPDKVIELAKGEIGFKGLIPVHLGGVVCDMETLKIIADQYSLWIIEDACHALGGQWSDKNDKMHTVGDCSHSDMTIFSFHPVKQITTGEGGAITTNNKDIYKKLLTLRTHGMTKDKELLKENHGGWYYEMQELGFNYRMTDIQASLGIEQLKKNDEWVKKRRKIVSNYDKAFKNVEQLIPQKHPDKNGEYSYHLYIIQCEKRAELYQFLKENDVNTQVHYIPIHLQPYYKNKYGYGRGDFPESEKYYDNALSLPLYQTLKDSEQEQVISLVKKFYE
ncbi:MAG: UDP-4-amino-4,6-dideoxy-N-acetyl-beta-L-altrosamine transaminase [Candidatus Marinimicrobia bacterium]|nr:UDP-4-amino-4,6-dideoxy-N-acetyl-beta-L-altrosamine transaminase [Candidatus Neomarinimicrobiota bacterium]